MDKQMSNENVEVDEITPDDLTEEQKQKALILYAKNLTNLRRYNITHKEEINEKAKQTFRRIKEDPEMYEAYKQRKKAMYRAKHPKTK